MSNDNDRARRSGEPADCIMLNPELLARISPELRARLRVIDQLDGEPPREHWFKRLIAWLLGKQRARGT